MPKDLSRENAAIGKIVYEWWVNEYEQHQRERPWYITMGAAATLVVLYGLLTANYLFVLIIVLFGIIVYLHALQTPLQVYFAITEAGIIVGKKFYPYKELKAFWIIYNPPAVKNLYFSASNVVKHRLVVPLLNFDPRPIRQYLNRFVTENTSEEDEPLSDKLGRLLKLH